VRTLFDNPGSAAFTIKLTYNRVGQIATRVLNNDAYVWQGAYNVNRDYTRNGLNQYSAAGPIGFQYDARGNLKTSGALSYAYDGENRLVSGSGWRSASLNYDPLGRLQGVVPGTDALTHRRFLYDGDALIAEYDGNGAQVFRHVPGPGTDETALTYGGTAVADKRYYHADERGSIVSPTNTSGAVLATNSYDAYCISALTNVGRFSFGCQSAEIVGVGL
jgi:hypothetical protein